MEREKAGRHQLSFSSHAQKQPHLTCASFFSDSSAIKTAGKKQFSSSFTSHLSSLSLPSLSLFLSFLFSFFLFSSYSFNMALNLTLIAKERILHIANTMGTPSRDAGHHAPRTKIHRRSLTALQCRRHVLTLICILFNRPSQTLECSCQQVRAEPCTFSGAERHDLPVKGRCYSRR